MAKTPEKAPSKKQQAAYDKAKATPAKKPKGKQTTPKGGRSGSY